MSQGAWDTHHVLLETREKTEATKYHERWLESLVSLKHPESWRDRLVFLDATSFLVIDCVAGCPTEVVLAHRLAAPKH